jgi:hypothetical protein
MEIWGRRREKLLDDFKEARGYWKLKEKSLDCTLWRTHFGKGYGPVVRKRDYWMTMMMMMMMMMMISLIHATLKFDVTLRLGYDCLLVSSFLLLNSSCRTIVGFHLIEPFCDWVKNLSFLQNVQTGSGSYPTLFFWVGKRVYFLGCVTVDARSSPPPHNPPSTKLKNAYRNNFTALRLKLFWVMQYSYCVPIHKNVYGVSLLVYVWLGL